MVEVPGAVIGENSWTDPVGLGEVIRQVLLLGGLDLGVYRARTVERRVASRMRQAGTHSYLEYAERLAGDPGEVQALIGHVTIKVSRFFRNVAVFRRLRGGVLPALLSRRGAQSGLRIWSAGCGNGEEPYSLAMLLEEMERQGSTVACSMVYGTDVDREALAAAEAGAFHPAALEETPPEMVASHFTVLPGRFGPLYEISAGLRRWVSLTHHDLLSGTPPPRGFPFHLVLCRNVVIYLERPAQERVFRLLADSLLPGGYLCLGEAEELPRAQQVDFETIDRRARLYRKRASAGSTTTWNPAALRAANA